MAREDYQVAALEAIGMAHPLSEAHRREGHLAIGEVALDASGAALEAVVLQRRQWAATKIGRWLKDGVLTEPEALQLMADRIPLTFPQFVEIARKAPGLSEKLMVLESHLKQARAVSSRMRPAFPWFPGEQLRHVLVRQGVRWREMSQAREVVKERRMRLDAFLGRFDPMTFRFVQAHANAGFAPDADGYRAYLKAAHPKVLAVFDGARPPALIAERDRRQHTYVTGVTGSGKSELLKALIAATLALPDRPAIILIDPHGDLAEQVAHWPVFAGGDRLVYLAPYLIEGYRPTINPFEVSGLSEWERDVIVQEIVEAFAQLLKGELGGTLSVNMRALLYPCIQVLLDVAGSSPRDLLVFMDDTLNLELVALARQHPREAIRSFFVNAATGFQSPHFARTKAAIAAKLQSLRSTSVFDELVNGPTSLDLEGLVNDGKVLVFNLAKGRIGADASEAVGRFVLARLQGMALRRQHLAPEARRRVHLFIDECQNFISPATIAIMEEARKYALYLTLAQQVVGRGMSPETRKVVLNNTNLKFAGRTREDAAMADLMGTTLAHLQSLAPGQFMVQSGTARGAEIQVRNDLLGNAQRMSEADWRHVSENMRRYYRQTNAPSQYRHQEPVRATARRLV